MSFQRTPETPRSLTAPERLAEDRGREIDASIIELAKLVGAEIPRTTVEYGFQPSAAEQQPIDATAAQQVVDLAAHRAAKIQMVEPVDVNQQGIGYAQEAA